MKGKMAIIGDSDSIVVFSAIGVTPFPVIDSQSALHCLKNISKEYSIIFITDNIAEKIKEEIEKYTRTPYPIILSIPSKQADSDYSQNSLVEAMEKALGVNIFKN